MFSRFFSFSRFTLLVALCISAIAAWYSVLGLTAIFAGAVLPIIIMGGILEVAKITTTVWLHKYWDKAGIAIRTYLTGAVIALALLTSMGIFGFLSKAHLDQGVPTGDVAAKLALFDEKIKTEKDNILTYRAALKQMDDQVDQRLSRGTSEQGAERAVQIRRQQQGERNKLQKDINDAQNKIAQLNEQRAPIASQLRKVEAEVGPIRYVAALIYGDNPDANTLERAVRWVIIMLVVVFDPLAIILILAANNSLKWEKDDITQQSTQQSLETTSDVIPSNDDLAKEDIAAMNIVPPEEISEIVLRDFTEEEIKILDKKEENTVSEHSTSDFSDSNYTVKSYTILEPKINLEIPVQENSNNIATNLEMETESISDEKEVAENISEINNEVTDELQTEGVTTEAKLKTEGVYVMYEGKNTSLEALKHLRPDLLNSLIKNEILYGGEFPKVTRTGDIYIRTDVLPHRVYKFNGTKWMIVDKNQNSSYLQNISYLQFLIQKIDQGEYDPEYLTQDEEEEISNYLAKTS